MTEVRPGQIWCAYERLPNGEARYVRIDRIETRPEIQSVLGMTRTMETRIARVSTRPASRPDFRPTTRFIRLSRFATRYRLIEDAP